MRNAHDMLTDVRDSIKESSAAHWGDNDVLRKIRMSHRSRAMELAQVPGDWLVTSADITASSGVITVPTDFVKPVYLEHKSGGWKIPMNATVRERGMSRVQGASLGDGFTEAYLLGNTIVVNNSNFGDEVTLWYQYRPTDPITGTADTGTTNTTLVFKATDEPRFTNDYYNNQTIEVVSGTDVGRRTTISDYVGATRTATLAAGVLDTTSVYGTVSALPEEANQLIVLDATCWCLASPGAAIDPEYYKFYKDMYNRAKKTWDQWISERLIASNRIRVAEDDG